MGDSGCRGRPALGLGVQEETSRETQGAGDQQGDSGCRRRPAVGDSGCRGRPALGLGVQEETSWGTQGVGGNQHWDSGCRPRAHRPGQVGSRAGPRRCEVSGGRAARPFWHHQEEMRAAIWWDLRGQAAGTPRRGSAGWLGRQTPMEPPPPRLCDPHREPWGVRDPQETTGL